VYDDKAATSALYLVIDFFEDAEKMMEAAFGFVTGQDQHGRQPMIHTVRARREMARKTLAWCEHNVLLAHRHPRFFPHVRSYDGGGPLPDGYTGGGIGCPLRDKPPKAVLKELVERAYSFGEYEMIGVLSVRLVTRTCTERSTPV
jgi:hypothetical protein